MMNTVKISKVLTLIVRNTHSVKFDFGLNGFKEKGGAQWLSGRVLDSRPKGSGFEPHRRHCVVVLEQDTLILA